MKTLKNVLLLLVALGAAASPCSAMRYEDSGTPPLNAAVSNDGPNLYTYATQNPWSKFDPHGLYVDSETGVWHPNNLEDFERGGPPPLSPAGKMAVAAMVVGPLVVAAAPEVVAVMAPRVALAAASPAAQQAAPIAAAAAANAAVTYDETGSVPAATASAVITVVTEGAGRLPSPKSIAAGEVPSGGPVSPKPIPLAPPSASAKSPAATPQGPYSHLPDPPGVAAGKDFSQAQKAKFYAANETANSGQRTSDASKIPLIPAQQSRRGVTPPANESQIDHIIPKSRGGTNSNSNAQVLSRKENNEKSND